MLSLSVLSSVLCVGGVLSSRHPDSQSRFVNQKKKKTMGVTVFNDAFAHAMILTSSLAAIAFGTWLWWRVSAVRVRAGPSSSGREYLLEESAQGEEEVRCRCVCPALTGWVAAWTAGNAMCRPGWVVRAVFWGGGGRGRTRGAEGREEAAARPCARAASWRHVPPPPARPSPRPFFRPRPAGG